MDVVFWILAVALAAGVAWAFGASRMRRRYREVLERLARATGTDDLDRASVPGADLPGVAEVQAAVREATEGVSPERSEPARPGGRPGDADAFVRSALERMRGYLTEGVEEPLRTGLEEGGGALRGGVEDALVALEDLYFYLRDVPESRALEDLNEIAREAGDEYRDEWGVDVDVHVPERPTEVEVNREALLDALYLVLHNAATFGNGGSVEVVVRYQDGEGWLVVRDRGEGFDREGLERAFEPFYSTGRLGLGLGLYHVRKIVQAMGGTVHVRNWHRGGGQVEIVLPESSEES